MAPDLKDFVPEVEQSYKNTLSFDYGKLPKEKVKQFDYITAPHIESFDWFLDHGLPGLADSIRPREFQFGDEKNDDKYKLEIESITIEKPELKTEEPGRTRQIYPMECRARKINYESRAEINYILTNTTTGQSQTGKKEMTIPIMVGSSKCNLRGLSPKKLVKVKEDHYEMGGYFICGGNEKVIRLLNMNKRNHPMGLFRGGFAKRRAGYQQAGVMIRSINKWEQCANLNLHINRFQQVEIVIYIEKRLTFLPLMMFVRALCNWNDLETFLEFIQTMRNEPTYVSAIKRMLNDTTNTAHIKNQNDALNFIGKKFRMMRHCPDWYTDIEVARYYLSRYCLIHLNNDLDKVRLLAFMTRKLFRLSQNRGMVDNPDSPENHEALLPGHLFQTFTHEILEEGMKLIVGLMKKEYKIQANRGNDEVSDQILKFGLNQCPDFGKNINYLIATGNLRSRTGLGLQQMAGLVVTAEKINFARFYCHFRTIHRGAFFMDMKTTTPRKLATASWGFICPVNTPDGPPCGLMNHLAHTVKINLKEYKIDKLVQLLPSLGMKTLTTVALETDTPITLDGRLIGWIEADRARQLELRLRHLKIHQTTDAVPETLEIVHCPKPLDEKEAVSNPGIYLYTSPARFMRPVWNLIENKIEIIGCMEQVWLNICVTGDERNELTEYQEISTNAILSELACMTPFSHMNAGARNIYQCQMAKQTFGVPSHTLSFRSDNKMYRIQTPQEPMCRAKVHDAWKMDDLPLGTNLMVACISYTGYDMEDACIINKMGKERGLMYGTIYKTKILNLSDYEAREGGEALIFGCQDPENPNDVKKYLAAAPNLALDGFPYAGSRITDGQAYCCYWSPTKMQYFVEKYSSAGDQTMMVESVRIFTPTQGRADRYGIREVALMFRIARPMTIGDKMASRHGQKGICSRLWATADLPWTENGMVPDLIFNPHGFPSRMTVGMMVELLAGKAGAVNGRVYDSTPFIYDEAYPADIHFGEVLKQAGLNYHGCERMYSGFSGEELEAEIFFGPIYYQRLRHMVGDKFQARASRGPNDPVTTQPVKGRAKGGGVRLGEMERDGLISHGCTLLGRDRLFQSSDYSVVSLCSKCGNLLAPTVTPAYKSSKFDKTHKSEVYECGSCGPETQVIKTEMPFVMVYLAAELACMNVKMQFSFSEKENERINVIE